MTTGSVVLPRSLQGYAFRGSFRVPEMFLDSTLTWSKLIPMRNNARLPLNLLMNSSPKCSWHYDESGLEGPRCTVLLYLPPFRQGHVVRPVLIGSMHTFSRSCFTVGEKWTRSASAWVMISSDKYVLIRSCTTSQYVDKRPSL